MYDENKIKEAVNCKCPNCGSTVRFDPETQNLICDSCGSTISLEKKEETIEEYDFNTYLTKYKENKENMVNTENKINIRCEDCGALIIMDSNQLSTECPFCGSNKTIKQIIENEVIHIEGIIPFQISIEDSNELFSKWIKSRFWAPSKIKKAFYHPNYYSFYMPIWTYDANTFSNYTGMRGDYYYVTRTVGSGKDRRTITERRIRWTPVSGTFAEFFDDIVIRGSKNVLDSYIQKVAFFNLKEATKYDEKFLLGYQAEKPAIDLEEGFNRARNVISKNIRNHITKKIGGDTVSNLNINTKYENVTFKQMLCPLYNGTYQIAQKKYHFVINGQNGKFHGDYPKSALKITMFILIILIIIATISLIATL